MSNFHPFQCAPGAEPGVGGDRFVSFLGGQTQIAMLPSGEQVKFECLDGGIVRAVIGGNVVGVYKCANGAVLSKSVEARFESKLDGIVRRSAAFSPNFPTGVPDGHADRVRNSQRSLVTPRTWS